MKCYASDYCQKDKSSCMAGRIIGAQSEVFKAMRKIRKRELWRSA